MVFTFIISSVPSVFPICIVSTFPILKVFRYCDIHLLFSNSPPNFTILDLNESYALIPFILICAICSVVSIEPPALV